MQMDIRERAEKANIYNLSALIRVAIWGKRMPKYEQVFRGKRSRRKMSDEEMYNTVLALNGKWGGSEV